MKLRGEQGRASPTKAQPQKVQNPLMRACHSRAYINEDQRSPLSGDFRGVFDFLTYACSQGIPVWDPLRSRISTIFTNAPLGHTPSRAGTFLKKFRKNSGKTPETLSELFLKFPSRVRLGSPKRYNSRHLKPPEHFRNSLPLSTGRGALFFRSGSGEGLSEPTMEFPAVLRVSLTLVHPLVFTMPLVCTLLIQEDGSG